MELSTLLRTECVRVLSAVASKKRVLSELAEIASGPLAVKSADVFDALQERETLGPTGVGHGVALPHARLAGVPAITGLFLKVDKAVDFGAVDRQPVDLVFALLAPEDAGVEHLKALALVARTMRDAGVCAKLRANNDPATLHAVLVEPAASQAA